MESVYWPKVKPETAYARKKREKEEAAQEVKRQRKAKPQPKVVEETAYARKRRERAEALQESKRRENAKPSAKIKAETNYARKKRENAELLQEVKRQRRVKPPAVHEVMPDVVLETNYARKRREKAEARQESKRQENAQPKHTRQKRVKVTQQPAAAPAVSYWHRAPMSTDADGIDYSEFYGMPPGSLPLKTPIGGFTFCGLSLDAARPSGAPKRSVKQCPDCKKHKGPESRSYYRDN